jgi:outer membrane protein assembly factor BamB
MRAYKIVSFSVVILLITVLFAGAVTVPAAAQYDTMQYQYNAQHTGDYSPVAGPVSPNGQLKWSFTAGSVVISCPAIANGVVYVGSADGNLYALNATTGTQLWNYTVDLGYSSPAVVNGVVYVGSEDGNVYALNATTGTQLWNFTTVWNNQNGNSIESSPAVANGVVYVGSLDNNVYALNATTGAKVWNYTTGSAVWPSPAVSNGVVYVGSNDGNLYALNATTGAKVWNYTTGSDVYSSPAVSNGVVYVGSNNGNVYAINATTGTKLWNYTAGRLVWSSPAIANGIVYAGSDDGNLYAINATTGTELWNYTTGNPVFSSPAVANGVVYVGSFDKNFYAINATTGTELWNYTTGNPVFSSPAVSNGVVYVGSEDDHLYAIGNEPNVPTALTVTAPMTVAANRPFWVNGTLNTTAASPVAGATIQLQKNVSGTWTNVTRATNVTTSTGAYRISTSGSTVGVYQYRTTYSGNDTYINATSNVAQVTVVPGTQLSLSTVQIHVTSSSRTHTITYAISGTLTTTPTPVGIANAKIYLQWSKDNTNWSPASSTPAVTNANGAYAFKGTLSPGTYYFRTAYSSTSPYASSVSRVVKVSVSSTGSSVTDV